MDRFKLYSSVFKAYVEAFPSKSRSYAHKKWNAIKDNEVVKVKVDGLLYELKAITMKHKGSFIEF